MARGQKARKDNALSNGNGGRGKHVWTDEQRRVVQETAYFRAEHRGFQGGAPEEDWYAAEEEVLAQAKARAQRQ